MNASSRSDAPPPSPGGWWTRQHTLQLVLVAVTALSLYACFLLTQPFLPALSWALALAVVAFPLHKFLENQIARPNIATAFSVLAIALVVVAPASFVVQRLVSETVSGARNLQAALASADWRRSLQDKPRLAAAVKWIEERVEVQATVEHATTQLTTTLTGLVKSSMLGVLQLVITFYLLFYLLRDHQAGLRALRSFVPLDDRETDQLFQRVADTIHATVYGTIAVACVQGALGGLMFWWLGLPAPLLWGVVMALLAIVPVLGTFVIWIPATVWLALQGHWAKAMILAFWGGIVIGIVDNLLYPVLVGQRLRLHPVLVFIALVGGLTWFGAAGLLIGPVILAATHALLGIWKRRTDAGRGAETPTPPAV